MRWVGEIEASQPKPDLDSGTPVVDSDVLYSIRRSIGSGCKSSLIPGNESDRRIIRIRKAIPVPLRRFRSDVVRDWYRSTKGSECQNFEVQLRTIDFHSIGSRTTIPRSDQEVVPPCGEPHNHLRRAHLGPPFDHASGATM